jgi:hypothetical protein
MATGLLLAVRDRAGASMVRVLAYAIAATLLLYVATGAAPYLFRRHLFFASIKVSGRRFASRKRVESR